MRSREEVERLAEFLSKVSEVFWSLRKGEAAAPPAVENEFFTAQVEVHDHSADVYVRGKDYCLDFFIASYDEGPINEAWLAARILRWVLGERVVDTRCAERLGGGGGDR